MRKNRDLGSAAEFVHNINCYCYYHYYSTTPQNCQPLVGYVRESTRRLYRSHHGGGVDVVCPNQRSRVAVIRCDCGLLIWALAQKHHYVEGLLFISPPKRSPPVRKKEKSCG
jgi:hypothetical protein